MFGNNQKAIEDYIDENETELADGYSIENITNISFFMGNGPEDSTLPRWFQNTDVTKAIFLNKVVPKNTVLLFAFLSNLSTIENISNLYTNNVTNMSGMFMGCSSLTTLNLSSFDTSNVTDMNNMFSNCSDLRTLNLSSFDTSNVTDMNSMFGWCSSLESITFGSGFDTSNVTDMSFMFAYSSGLGTLDVSNFNTSNVTNMEQMFSTTSRLKTLDLTNFNTNKVINMNGMFQGCIQLQTIYASSNFSTKNVSSTLSVFPDCSSLVGGNGTTFNSNKVDKTYARIDGGPTSSTPGYFTAKTN